MFQSKTIVKLEELAYLLLSIYLFSRLSFAWWVFPLFFFAPDVSLLLMLVHKRAGAFVYNVIHHKALAVIVFLVGSLFNLPVLSLTGVVLLGHSSFDRVLGFGFVNAEAKPATTTA